MTKDGDRKHEFRKRIVSAALRCIAENGYDNTAIQSVCREAGTTSSTFYNYFESKRDLLFEAFEQVASHDAGRFDRIIEDLNAHAGKQTLSGLKDLGAVISGRETRQMSRLRMEVWGQATKDREIQTLLNRWSEALSQQISKRIPCDPAVADLLISTYLGAAFRREVRLTHRVELRRRILRR